MLPFFSLLQFDVQIRFFAKSIRGEFELPSKQEMIQDTLEEKRAKADAGIAERHFHKMGKLFNHTNLLYELPITNWWNLEFFFFSRCDSMGL